MALSFDDPPTPDSVLMTGSERTRRIIETLEEKGVDQAIFFAVTSRIDSDSIKRLEAYAEAGHLIGSHSHTHANLHRVGADEFIEDIKKADSALSGVRGFHRYFRFPYLNEGQTIEERDLVRQELRLLGYKAGYVTIDNFDFYIDRLLRSAKENGDHVDLAPVRDIYVDMILGAAEHYDAVACKWIGRSPRHVLLLHENDVAALFLADLIDAFRAAGWEIITPIDAYGDPIASVIPDTLYLGQGQVAAIAAAAGADTAQLRHVGESIEFLASEFQKALMPSKDE